MNTQYNDPKGAIGATKTPLGLIPPYAMEQTAWVHKLGAEKYGPHNWRKTGVCASTYVNAIMRHLNAWRDGEDLDPESGISHVAHVACCCNILLDAEYCGKLQDDRSKVKSYAKLHELFSELKRAQENEPERQEYRVLEKGEELRDGDEVYVGFGDWLPLYISHWVKQKVNDGTYRRKLITNCDLNEVANCDLKETCGSKTEPQNDLTFLDVHGEQCRCGKKYTYHWLFGWLCEDCELKHKDPYDQ